MAARAAGVVAPVCARQAWLRGAHGACVSAPAAATAAGAACATRRGMAFDATGRHAGTYRTATQQRPSGAVHHHMWQPRGLAHGAPPAAQLLFVHGLNEHGGRFDRAAQHVFVPAGFSVTAVDLHGHGKSSGKHGLVRSLAPLVADVVAVAREMGSRWGGGVPLFLFGQSLGGLVVLEAARVAAPLPALAGIVAQAPTVQLAAGVLPHPAAQRALQLVAAVAPGLPTVPPTASASYHPDVAAARLRDDARDALVYSHRVRAGTGAAVVAAAAAFRASLAAGAYAHFDTPVLLQHGDADGVCDVAGSAALAAALPRATLQRVPGGYHDLLRERDAVAHAALTAARAWMAAQATDFKHTR